MRHVLEVVASLLDACRSSEVVERDSRIAALREAERELLVEAVEAADVGKDDDPRGGRFVRRGPKRGEAVPVQCREHELVVRDRGPGNDGNRRQGVGVEAHEAGAYFCAWYKGEAMTEEQSHREEMNAAIRAQRERQGVAKPADPKGVAPEKKKALLSRLLGK